MRNKKFEELMERAKVDFNAATGIFYQIKCNAKMRFPEDKPTPSEDLKSFVQNLNELEKMVAENTKVFFKKLGTFNYATNANIEIAYFRRMWGKYNLTKCYREAVSAVADFAEWELSSHNKQEIQGLKHKCACNKAISNLQNSIVKLNEEVLRDFDGLYKYHKIDENSAKNIEAGYTARMANDFKPLK